MASLPLAVRLKKRAHRELAFAQDLVVIELYNQFPGAVLHGGTAIWRCYGGNRFSEDVDAYLSPSSRKRLGGVVEGLGRRGLAVQKFKQTDNAAFGKFSYAGFSVRLEAIFRVTRNYAVKSFEMSDGTLITVKVLPPQELVLEKVSAYTDRRKVRDLYDIFYLAHLTESSGPVRKEIRKLLQNFQRPDDEGLLKSLIISGAAPTVKGMLEEIERWAG